MTSVTGRCDVCWALRLVMMFIIMSFSCHKLERKEVCGTVALKLQSIATFSSYVKVNSIESPTPIRIEVPWDEWASIEIGSYYCGLASPIQTQ